MIGIYKITNLINGKVYIGQSQNIESRFKEHLYHHNASNIGRDIYKYKAENFSFEILEECSKEELDEKEDYYIYKYNSIENGYNLIKGGQNNIGESNSNAKLSREDVYKIREAYKNHQKQYDIYQKYSNKISLGHFQAIWQGRSWCDVHMDVYTEDNKNFYKSVQVKDFSYLKDNRKITDEDVYDIRESYKNHQNKHNVYIKYQNKISESYFDKIWNGSNYKHIHYDVYTQENRDYQKRQSISLGSSESKFTDEDVLYYRRKYAYEGISIIDLYREFQSKGNECIYNTFYDMVKSKQYKRIPKPPIKFK